MRPRQDALKNVLRAGAFALASASSLAVLPGCGAIFHTSQQIEIVTRPEDKAIAYAGGTELTPTAPGRFTTPVFLKVPVNGTPIIIAPGKRIAEAKLERQVSVAAIVCDVLLSVTIIGVAAPISDALLGTFTKIGSPVDVTLVPDSPDPNPMPTYGVAGATVPTADEAVVVAAAPRPPAKKR